MVEYPGGLGGGRTSLGWLLDAFHERAGGRFFFSLLRSYV